MDDDSSSSSSSTNTTSTSSTTVAASKQLQRRLNGLGPMQWGAKTDMELLTHLFSADSLLHFDILSDCINRMAEHVIQARRNVQKELFLCMTRGYAVLCKVSTFALQQLAESVQQYLQQGQLPAALTERAFEACYSLCTVLKCVLRWFIQAKESWEDQAEILRQSCYQCGVQEGVLYGAFLLLVMQAQQSSIRAVYGHAPCFADAAAHLGRYSHLYFTPYQSTAALIICSWQTSLSPLAA
jgi:hypothetical protein